jgi:hypothetical protein
MGRVPITVAFGVIRELAHFAEDRQNGIKWLIFLLEPIAKRRFFAASCTAKTPDLESFCQDQPHFFK